MRLPFFVLLIPLIALTSPSAASENAHQVLILHSYHQGQGWTDQQRAGVRAALDDTGKDFALYVEHLDSKRWTDPSHHEAFLHLLSVKYSSVLLDAILVTDNDAFQFITRHRDDLFDQVPVVFSGVNFFRDELLVGVDDITGVAETFDAGSTIALMETIHPDTRRIVVVVDATTTGEALRKELSRVIADLSTEIQFEFWDDRTLTSLRRDLAQLGHGDLVLLMPFARDIAGNHLEYRQAAELVSQATEVPVYGTWDFYLGHGIVGGRLTTAYGQGMAAGTLLTRVLNGEDPSQLPVERIAPTRFQFDARQLQRHGIDRGDLPADSEILFSRWDDNHAVFLAAIATLSLIILGLLHAWRNKYLEKRAADQRLLHSERRFREMFERSPDPTWIIESDHFTDCNQAAVNRLGYADRQQLLQMRPEDLSPDAQPDGEPSVTKARRMLAQARRNGVHRFDWMHRERSGALFWAEVTLSQVDSSNTDALYCVWRDITEHKAAEAFMQQHTETLEKQVADRTEALQKAMLQAEQANAAKSRFLANVSHELRTPMHAILSYANLGLKHAKDARLTRYLRNIRSSGERLTALIDDLLDLSLLEAGAVAADSADNDMRDVAGKAVTELRALADEKNIALIIDGDDGYRFAFDASLMTRVLINILANAIKFSPPESTVRISLSAPASGSRPSSDDRYRIEVVDSGSGIPETLRETLFDKFVHGEQSRAQSGGGTGLGLSICKEIIDLHHGEIRAESPPVGQQTGTAIHIELPVAPVARDTVDIATAARAHERWHTMITTLISGASVHTPITVSAVRNHRACPLGEWLASHRHAPIFDDDAIRTLSDAHEALHNSAAVLVGKIVDGHPVQETERRRFDQASSSVIQLLRALSH